MAWAGTRASIRWPRYRRARDCTGSTFDMPQTRRRLTGLPRAALALVAGAATGAVLVALWSLQGQAATWGPGYVAANGLRTGATVFLLAMMAWLLGLICFASLPWWALHRLGRRGWPSAILLGAVLTFAVGLAGLTGGFGLLLGSASSVAVDGGSLVVDGRLTEHGWRSAISGSLLLAVAGAAAGAVIWRVAYRGPGALGSPKGE